MKTILAILAAGTALVAVPAMAQGAPDDAGSTFTGPRVGAIIGYDKSKSGSSVDNDALRDRDQSIDGLLYGGDIGYDVPLGQNLRLGAEAELTGSTAKVNNAVNAASFNLGRVKAGRDIYAGARLGYVISPRTMLYVKGGYTNARYNLLGTDGTTNLNQRLDTDGYRVGAGAEMALSRNAYAKVEYRYSNYRRAEFDFNGQTPDSSRFRIDTDRHQVVVGAGVRF
ncbi:outer membrane protein [Novosphingobium lentum]|uniref:outer membrane protein n=1 Tax=Novosphingobium lentum TaxID=145287 RepID=UPI00082CB81C|nr:porin family protein [Novosphingobium lentum]